jgi:hypothetical protein
MHDACVNKKWTLWVRPGTNKLIHAWECDRSHSSLQFLSLPIGGPARADANLAGVAGGGRRRGGAGVLVASRVSSVGSLGLLPRWRCWDRSGQIWALGSPFSSSGSGGRSRARRREPAHLWITRLRVVSPLWRCLFSVFFLRPAVAARRGRGQRWWRSDREAAGVALLWRVCASPRGGMRRTTLLRFLLRPAVVARGWGRGWGVGRPSPACSSATSFLALGVPIDFFLTWPAVEARGWGRRVQWPPERMEESASLRSFGFLRRLLCGGHCWPSQSKAIGLAMPCSTTTTRSRAPFSSARGSSAELQRQRSPPPSQVVSSPARTGVVPPRLCKPPSFSGDLIAFARSPSGCLL